MIFLTAVTRQEKSKHWLVFGLAAAIGVITFLIPTILGKGYFTYYGDFNVQQIPFYIHAHDAIRSGNVLWDWGTDLGSNFLGSYSFYLLFSPFFWLTLPFPSAAVPYMMAPLLVLKLASAAFTSYFYFERFVKNKDYAVVGALLYAYSGFSMYNVFFNHFHEAIVFFPLMLIGLEKLLTENKRGFFALAVFVNAFVNYWFFIGEVVFVILYFFIRTTAPDCRFSWNKLWKTALEAVIGVGISCVALLPSVLAILGNPRTTLSENMNWGWGMLLYNNSQRLLAILFNPFYPGDMPSRPNFFPDHGANWSSLASWLPVVSAAGIIAYLLSRKKDWLKKMILACVFIACVPVLNSLFVLLNNSYYTRWFYMFTMMTALASIIALERSQTDEIDFERGLKWTVGITIVVIAAIGLTPKKVDGEIQWGLAGMPDLFWGFSAITLAGILVMVLLFYHFRRSKLFARAMVVGVAAFCAFYSSVYVMIGYFGSGDNQYIIDTAIEGRFDLDLPDDEFARSDFYDTTTNLGLFWGLPNIQAFHSVVPVSIMEFYPEVGVKRDVSSKPQTELYDLRALLSVKWLFISQSKSDQEPMPGFTYYDTQLGYNIYTNDNFIPMGFTYTQYMDEDTFEAIATTSRSANMLRAILLTDEQIEKYGDLLTPMDVENFSMNYDDVSAAALQRAQSSGWFFETDSLGFTSKITLAEDNLVFFSVPYEKGWSATVNGEPVEVEKVNLGFMAVKASAGENVIRFTFVPPGLVLGAGVTAGSILLLIVYLLVWKRWRRSHPDPLPSWEREPDLSLPEMELPERLNPISPEAPSGLGQAGEADSSLPPPIPADEPDAAEDELKDTDFLKSIFAGRSTAGTDARPSDANFHKDGKDENARADQ